MMMLEEEELFYLAEEPWDLMIHCAQHETGATTTQRPSPLCLDAAIAMSEGRVFPSPGGSAIMTSLKVDSSASKATAAACC